MQPVYVVTVPICNFIKNYKNGAIAPTQFYPPAAAFIDNNLKDTTNNDCLTPESFRV